MIMSPSLWICFIGRELDAEPTMFITQRTTCVMKRPLYARLAATDPLFAPTAFIDYRPRRALWAIPVHRVHALRGRASEPAGWRRPTFIAARAPAWRLRASRASSRSVTARARQLPENDFTGKRWFGAVDTYTQAHTYLRLAWAVQLCVVTCRPMYAHGCAFVFVSRPTLRKIIAQHFLEETLLVMRPSSKIHAVLWNVLTKMIS